jgi:signal transduction histidine kinase
MKDQGFKYSIVIMAAVMILLSIIAESVYFSDFEYWFRTKRFNRILREKEKIMDDCLDGMKPILARGESHGSLSENNLFSLAEENRITILEYIENKLIYWSDNDFEVSAVLNDTTYQKPLIFIQNGWFITKTVQAGNEKIVGLLRLRNDYGFENDIVKNGFLEDFGVSGNVGLSIYRKTSGFPVFSKDGLYLFSLIYPPDKEGSSYFIALPLLLWAFSFLVILFLAVKSADYLAGKKRQITALTSGSALFALIYLIILVTQKPALLSRTEVFSPYRYSMNALIPSLGHLLIFSFLASALAFIFYRYGELVPRLIRKSKHPFITLSLMLIPAAFLFLFYHRIICDLIINSNINFETYKILELNILSLAGFICISLLFSVPFLYLLKVMKSIDAYKAKSVFKASLMSLSVFPVFLYKEPFMLLSVALFYLLTVFGIRMINRWKTGSFSRSVIFSLITGCYFLFIITSLSEKKTEEKIKIQLVSYSTENDPTAEHLLLDMWPEISADSSLRKMMNVEYFQKDDVDRISDYLHDRYFNGFWGNFNINVILCIRNDSLRIADTGEVYDDCFSFFDNKVLKQGDQLTGTGFYFMDNKQGRTNYLGRLFFKYDTDRVSGLFVDLYSDINVFQPGYSELLLDKKYHSYARLKDYSFAKYVNGELALRTGDFPYNKSDGKYVGRNTDYRIFAEDSYKHVLYRNGNVTVLISRPGLSFQDIIISFAYLFSFIIIFVNLVFIFVQKPVFLKFSGLNFREKLQMSFISILLLSFGLVAYIIATLAIDQYQTKHFENMREKLYSVYNELESRISSEKPVISFTRSNNFTYLDESLVKLSNIFNTDINLYDLTGHMIATSRPEIFYRNLISRRMNNMAFINLANSTRSEYFQKERIGNLEYISAYIPFYGPDNSLLMYLNLPYFRMQSVLTREISNTIVAVVNFTLLLIVITMGLAVFISGRLTAPLTLLSSRLASVELGKKSEHLQYNGSDEVGDLVRQYNRMVDELDDSAGKLARSEREYAWREMAKQIAHEIKNPLTPMKLNVQQLLKSWKDGVPGFEKKLERFTKSQIDYIDNLSSIATAFSSFAKMPEANPLEVDLAESLRTTLELFKSSENITFRIGLTHGKKIIIYADKEHINGIFSNLIKNGIQSIPPGREGIIKINMEAVDEKVIVSVADNGVGIPLSLHDKMFTPNFTTKSSGTGLGLSIVKRYVEGAGGKIWFESEADKGTIFYIEFPLIMYDKKPVNQL